jgi:hypothetical protein
VPAGIAPPFVFTTVKMIEKTAILGSRLWVVLLLAGLAAAARAADAPDSSSQPQALGWAGVYALQQAEPNLTGTGLRVAVICRSATYNDKCEPQNDYQPNAGHICFQNAKLHFYNDPVPTPGVSSHSTAICSILFGADPRGTAPQFEPFPYRGVVPAAEGHIYEFWHFVTKYVYAQAMPEADVAVASFGQPLESEWTRGIEALIEHQGLVVVASIGNGSNASNPPFYPGAGPDAIGVGVVSSVNATDPATKLSHFALAYPEESSVGPTQDGRCKPDVIAPGNCLVAETDGEEGYTVAGDWSSYAAPVAAGAVGLLIQAARQDPNLAPAVSPEGGSCVLKAVLMSSATKLPYWHKGRLSPDDDHETPLDYVQGAGMVNAVGAYRVLKAGQGRPGDVPATGWDLNQLSLKQPVAQVYRMVVEEPGSKMLTATLVWNRHYRNEYPFKRLADSDNDLRLEVWAVDPLNPNNSLLLDYSDSRTDNVEHICVAADAEHTIYEIVVSYSMAEGRVGLVTDERYGLAWTVAEKPAGDDILWHDLNADGVVDEQDFAILMNNLVTGLKSPQAYVIGDVNKDGTIDDKDLTLIGKHRDERAPWRTESVTN